MIAMGTDSGTGLGRWQGYFEHVEMELMVKAGMTPMQTLVAATGNAAKVMEIDAELGTLQPGKRADFVVLTADPLADISNTRTIESVWIDGRRMMMLTQRRDRRKEFGFKTNSASLWLCESKIYCGNRPSAVSRSSRAR